MRLHVFNPDHDLALASNLVNFTAPHAGRQLAHALAFLPALWADDGDVVLVEDVAKAKAHFVKLSGSAVRQRLSERVPLVRFVSYADIRSVVDAARQAAQSVTVDPWGWNHALCARLRHLGLSAELMPSKEQIDVVRRLSHRRTARQLLSSLRYEGTLGEAFECMSVAEVLGLIRRYGAVAVKAPWSSSGRGIRFCNVSMLDGAGEIDSAHRSLSGWLRHTIERQGSVMVEPYYRKVKDFGMEFTALDNGEIRYDGLSLFYTANGAYKGNVLATEKVKDEMLRRYIADDCIEEVKTNICRYLPSLLGGGYVGPFGVDMMICTQPADVSAHDNHRFLLHPCVEINLRRTMGHVALSLSPDDDDITAVMQIDCDKVRLKKDIC